MSRYPGGVTAALYAALAATFVPGCSTQHPPAIAPARVPASPVLIQRLEQGRDAAASALARIQLNVEALAAGASVVTPEAVGATMITLSVQIDQRLASIQAAAGPDMKSPEVKSAIDAFKLAVRRLEASGAALTRGLPEAGGSLSDCREALDAAIAKSGEAIKALGRP